MKAIKFLTEAFFTLALIIISAATFSCSKSSNLRSIEEENLFSLNYGTYEDELQLFSLDAAGQINTNIVMKEGFFFISDDYAKKIMQFTSFGDLTGIIYNPNTNPEPSFVRKIGNSQDNDSNIKSATQSAREHKFNSIEDIAIDSNKNIFVVDQISPERQETDPKTNLILREIVLKFSNDGKFSNYYGQEGIGGTPFPFIKNIFTTGGNELVVTSLSPEGYTVYWFDKNG
ncbi:MAG: hypothetical protein K5839_04730, partial [Treponemataceae bacterium]|nr:hypothetical protein [Treponemataceae bacterium]